MNEDNLLKVLANEEKIKMAHLSNLERTIYEKPLNIIELEELKKEVSENKKKFSVSEETLTLVATVKIKTKRLYNIMSDEDYNNHVFNNVYDVRKVSEEELMKVIKSWIEDFSCIKEGGKLHLCFDTESCETRESYENTMKIVEEHFPNYDINNPDERLGQFNEYLDSINYIRSVRVYSWSLGSVGSDKQIHGETLEQFENTINLIFECMKVNPVRKQNRVAEYSQGIIIDVHNLAWDMEFLKYYWRDNHVKSWYNKTTKDDIRTVTMLYYEDGTLKGEEKAAYKQVMEQQPEKTYSVIIGNNQVYECKWQLENKTIEKTRKQVTKEYNLRRNVHFYDMVKKVPLSLKKVSGNVIIDEHFKKAENYDYTKIRDVGTFLSEEETQYQYNDVYIMCKYLQQIYYGRNLQGTTASGIAFNSLMDYRYPDIKNNKYKEGFQEHFPTMLHNSETYLIRKFYRDMYEGGFTMGVKQLEGEEVDGILIGIDINSAYPYQMKEGSLPYGLPRYGLGKFNPEDESLQGYDIVFQRVKYDGFERKGKGIEEEGEGYGFIQLGNSNETHRIVRNKNNFKINGYNYTKRERPFSNMNEEGEPILENFESFWSWETLEFMKETHDFWHYKREKVLHGDKYYTNDENDVCEFIYDERIEGLYYVDYVCFKSERGYFGNFIDDYILQKQIGKMLDNEGLTLVAKMCMNSCSGKMGSSYLRENTEVVTRSSGLLGYIKPIENKEYHVNREYYVPYIAFITDYTRLRLMKIIYELESVFGFKSFSFQGCDTDSLYIKIPYSKDMNTIRKMIDFIKTLNIEIDAIKLGAWDVEKIIFKYKNLGSKKMMMDFIKFKDVELDKDVLEYMKEYKEGKIKTKVKVTCAGLPDGTRNEISEKGFGYFGKDIEYRKLIKEKCYGGYMLNWGTHKIKDSLFN